MEDDQEKNRPRVTISNTDLNRESEGEPKIPKIRSKNLIQKLENRGPKLEMRSIELPSPVLNSLIKHTIDPRSKLHSTDEFKGKENKGLDLEILKL